MTDTTRKTLAVSGVVALVGSIVGLVLGLLMVNNLSDYLTQSVAVSESALGAVEETLNVLESVSVEVDEGIGAAAASIAAASDAVLTASGELDDVADFLDGELQASIETLLDTMPAAIQTAGVIDGTLNALSFLGVDYDPEQPFDASLMAAQDALEAIPPQLTAQAEAIRALVPVSEQFAEDAAATAEAFDALRVETGVESNPHRLVPRHARSGSERGREHRIVLVCHDLAAQSHRRAHGRDGIGHRHRVDHPGSVQRASRVRWFRRSHRRVGGRREVRGPTIRASSEATDLPRVGVHPSLSRLTRR